MFMDIDIIDISKIFRAVIIDFSMSVMEGAMIKVNL